MLYSALLLAAVAGSTVAAPCPNAAQLEARYKQHILEDYDTYHLRYIALDCHKQHNSSFFDDCCRPVKAGVNATEVLNDYCTPNATALESAAARIASRTSAVPSGSAVPSDDSDDADAAFCSATESVAVSGYTEPTATAEAASAAAPSEAAPSAAAPSEAASSSDAASTSSEAAAPAETSAPAPAAEVVNDAAVEPSTSSSSEKPQPTQESQPENNNNNNNAPAPDTSGGDWITGTASFYDQDDGVSAGQAASCGTRYSNSDHVVALPASHGFNTGNQGYGCGGTVTIQYGDKVITAPAVDACPTCGPNQIDLSTSLWQALESDTGKGILDIKWKVSV